MDLAGFTCKGKFMYDKVANRSLLLHMYHFAAFHWHGTQNGWLMMASGFALTSAE